MNTNRTRSSALVLERPSHRANVTPTQPVQQAKRMTAEERRRKFEVAYASVKRDYKPLFAKLAK